MGFGGNQPAALRHRAARGAKKDAAKTTYTMAEVAKHDTADDAWLVFGGRIYDVSNWLEHPGGRVLYTHAGKDCTDTFNTFHPNSAVDAMEPFYIGDLAAEDKKLSAFEREYRAMRQTIRKKGLTEASGWYYAFKCATNASILAAGVYLVLAYESMFAHFWAAALIALFWQQCGWLAHDFLHHQVFENRFFGDLFGLIIGNVSQGFSVEWWKDKHNSHHAVPNLLESRLDAHDGDPDIDTMPILAWSLEMARKGMNQDSAAGRFFMRHQAVLYFPILLIARMSWLMQSFTFVFRVGDGIWSAEDNDKKPLHLGKLEHVGLLLHYAWYGGLMLTMSPLGALMFLLSSQMICGFLLAIAFGVGHNGMAVYDNDKQPDFLTFQVSTTRNVDGNFMVGWFMGGLNNQIEHHLFPYVPRHHLGEVRKLVEPLCEKYGLKYHSTTLWRGTMEVLDHLAEVTQEIATEFPGI